MYILSIINNKYLIIEKCLVVSPLKLLKKRVTAKHVEY